MAQLVDHGVAAGLGQARVEHLDHHVNLRHRLRGYLARGGHVTGEPLDRHGVGARLKGRDYRISSASARAAAASHAMRGLQYQRVEDGGAHQAALGDDVAYRTAGLLRFLGDFGGLVVADLRVEQGGERDALADEEGAALPVYNNPLEILFGGGVR